jgi:hypothetical protein
MTASANIKNDVYAFYLKGRYYAGIMRIYGLLHIDSVWTNANNGLLNILIDVKINTFGQNYFIKTNVSDKYTFLKLQDIKKEKNNKLLINEELRNNFKSFHRKGS